jgi:hypothetical protein
MKQVGPGVRALVVSSVLIAATGFARPVPAAESPSPPTTAGCLTAAETSLALRNQRRLREARAQLLVCSAPSCPADVRTECIRRVTELNQAIPTVVFEAKDPAGNDLSDVKVTMDGQPLADRLDGPALTIDPGVHVFVFEAPGQPPVQKKFVIREGDRERRERVTLGSVPASVPAVVVVSAPTAPASPLAASAEGPLRPMAASRVDGAPPRSEAPPERGGTQRTIGVILGVAGVAAVATGVAYSLKYASDVRAFNDRGCSTQVVGFGSLDCQQRHDTDNLDRVLYIAGYASGAVLVGLGAFLFFSAPSGPPPPADVAQRPRRFSLCCLPTVGVGVSCGARF